MNKLEKFVMEWETAVAEMPAWFRWIFGGDDGFWGFLINNSAQGVAIGLAGWLLASYLERRHFKDLEARQAELQHIKLSTAKTAHPDEEDAVMLIGSTVVSHDFFRSFMIQIRKLIGGNIRAYDRLIARGRMEALTRMQEEAAIRGIDRIVNVRFASSPVAGRPLTTVELVAYGTGVKRRER